MTKDQATRLLRKAIGSRTAEFHEGQWEAIEALVNFSLLLRKAGSGLVFPVALTSTRSGD